MVWHVFSAAGFGVCDERTHPEAVFYLNIQGMLNERWWMNNEVEVAWQNKLMSDNRRKSGFQIKVCDSFP